MTNYLKNGKFIFIFVIALIATGVASAVFFGTVIKSFDSIDWGDSIALKCDDKNCTLIDFSIISMSIEQEPELEYYDDEKVVINGPLLTNDLDKKIHYTINVRYKQLGELDYEIKNYKSLSKDLEPGESAKVRDIDFDCEGKAWEIWYSIERSAFLQSNTVEKLYKYTVKPEDFKIQTHLPTWSKMNQPDFELRDYGDDRDDLFENEFLIKIAESLGFKDVDHMVEYLESNILVILVVAFIGIVVVLCLVIVFFRFLFG